MQGGRDRIRAECADSAESHKMALVGTRVETQQDGDTAVAVRTDVLVDTETGLLLERKTVVAEVLTESGNHKAVIAGQKTSIAAVQVYRIPVRLVHLHTICA